MEIGFDFGALEKAVKESPNAHYVAKAIRESSAVAAGVLHAAYTGTMLPGMTRRVNNPDASNAMHAVVDGPFSFHVQTAEEPENAVAPYDMKPGLLHGPKHRVNKQGQPYNIVPFTHKGADLPSATAELAAQLDLSFIIGDRLEVRSDDQWEVTRNVYAWGENTGKQADKRYSNMYKFGDDRYLTFRTVSTKSPANSWIHPGYVENPITESAWNVVSAAVESAVTLAWEKAVIDAWQS